MVHLEDGGVHDNQFNIIGVHRAKRLRTTELLSLFHAFESNITIKKVYTMLNSNFHTWNGFTKQYFSCMLYPSLPTDLILPT